MNILGNRIKSLRRSKKLNQEQLSEALNKQFGLKTDRVMISKWETGYQTPVINTIKCLAAFFEVTIDYLNGNENVEENIYSYKNIIPPPKMRKIPLLGTIACGEPILAQENIEGDVSIPESIVADFALRCKGDSMIDARIMDGDIVYIRQQPSVENGEIAAVLIGDEATLKKVYLSKDTLTLLACNSSYEPFVYSGEQLNEIRILGKAVGFTSKI